jgi:hypothetical protein
MRAYTPPPCLLSTTVFPPVQDRSAGAVLWKVLGHGALRGLKQEEGMFVTYCTYSTVPPASTYTHACSTRPRLALGSRDRKKQETAGGRPYSDSCDSSPPLVSWYSGPMTRRNLFSNTNGKEANENRRTLVGLSRFFPFFLGDSIGLGPQRSIASREILCNATAHNLMLARIFFLGSGEPGREDVRVWVGGLRVWFALR